MNTSYVFIFFILRASAKQFQEKDSEILRSATLPEAFVFRLIAIETMGSYNLSI